MTKDTDNGFLAKVDAYIEKRKNLLIGLCAFFTVFFGLFLFDAKMSVGGDDSAYIMRAMKFLGEGKFPSFQGALYPVFLSIFVGIFGIKIMLLKWISFALTLGWLWMFYVAFKDRLPKTVLGFTLLIASINSYVLYYASQTYNEAFFLVIEMTFVYFFLNRFEKVNDEKVDEKKSYKLWLTAGLWIFLITITKNIGLAALIACVMFLLWHRKWISSVYFVGSFIIFSAIYKGFKALFFDDGEAQISGQGNMLLYKDPYNKTKGLEDFSGFVDRFVQNAHLYLSKHYAKMLGLRDFKAITVVESFTYLFLGLFAWFMFLAFKRKNKILIFLGLYNAVVLGVTFIVLQTRWDQDRLIMLLFPFLTAFFLYGIYETFSLVKLRKLQPIAVIFMIAIFLFVGSETWSKSKKNITVFKRNLAGDKYYGYSPDWQNYLQMCEWTGKNLPDSSNVMVRKPSMAAIFGEINIFHGLYRLPTTIEPEPKIDADTMVKYMESNKITHVIMASLRKNQNVANGLTINTVQRALAMYTSKRPTGLKLVHQIGGTESAYLFEIVNNRKQSPDEVIQCLKSAVIINPTQSYYSFMLGNAYIQSQRFPEAAQTYTQAINNNEENGFEAFYNRGLAYINSQQFEPAIADFTKAIEKKPDYAGAWYNLGLAYLNSGDKANAKIAITNAEARGFSIPENIRVLLN